jgi:hypothetical protein
MVKKNNLFLASLSILVLLSLFCKKGPGEENYLKPINVSNNPGRSERPSIAVDSKGTVHLVWTDDTPGNEEIFYAFKPAGGSWSTPVNLSNNPRSSRFPSIKIDKNDVIHLAWQDCNPDGFWRIFYSKKSNNGTWSIPETITGGYMYVGPQLAVDDSGNVHLIWYYGGYYLGIRYAMRRKEGTWTPQTTVVGPIGVAYSGIAVDNQGNAHVVWDWYDFEDTNGAIYYSIKRKDDSVWSQPANISNTRHARFPDIIADNQGNVHIVWRDDIGPYLTPNLLYRMKRPDGSWTKKVLPCTVYKVYLCHRLAKGPNDELYLVGCAGHIDPEKSYILYITKPQGENWSDTIIIGIQLLDPYSISFEDLVCDNEGTIYIVGQKTPDPTNLKNKDIFCIEHKIFRR